MKFLWLGVPFLAVAAWGASMAAAGAPPATSGIYVSAVDYADHRLSLEGDCKAPSHKLVLHDVLHKSYIDVTHGAETKRYNKSDLFGFRSCEGLDYRFSGNREYQILEAKALYIYSTPKVVSQTKGFRTEPEYHFSVGADGPVLLLTLDNLKHAFPENHAFHDALDQMFAAGQNLAQYDTFHKMFKVNRLLVASAPADR